MEVKLNNQDSTPVMEEAGKETANVHKKLSYEELENVAKQLSTQYRELYAELYKLKEENFFKRLDYLFKVVENQSVFSVEYITQTKDEIISLLTLPGENETESEDNPN